MNSPADANRVPTMLGPHSHPITAHTAQVRCLLCGSYKSSDGQKGAIECIPQQLDSASSSGRLTAL